MDLEFLLPFLQQPANGAYNTPVNLSPHSYMEGVSDNINFSIILSSWPLIPNDIFL
jgi:hypothetical protein